jgi:rubrerythrin
MYEGKPANLNWRNMMLEDVTLKSCIEFAVVTEENGAKFYNRLAKKFADNREIADLFTLLAKDEQVHQKQFAELLKDAPQKEGEVSSPEKSQYVRAMSISEFFSPYQGPFTDVEKIKNRDNALEKAFAFERATLGFYQAVRDVLGKEPVLEKVIEAEKGHVTRLMKVMITGEKFRSLQDKWS